MILGFVSFTELLYILLVLGFSIAAILFLVATVGWFAWFLSRKAPVAPPPSPSPRNRPRSNRRFHRIPRLTQNPEHRSAHGAAR